MKGRFDAEKEHIFGVAAGKVGQRRLATLASSYVYQFIYDCVLTNRKAVILAIYTFMPPGKFNEQPAGRHKSNPGLAFELNRYRYRPCNRVENR